MIIETWVAALLLVGICILGGIGLLGWIVTSQNLKDEVELNKALIKENAQLKSKINFARLYIELEEKK
jgi:hypothetical protein